MKLRCLGYLLFLPVFSFFSCSTQMDTDDANIDETRYDYGKPVTVIINNLSEPFVPGTELLVGLNRNNALYSSRRFEARGNGPVNSGGTAELSLHYPTGRVFHGQESESNRLYILKDYQTMEILFQSKKDFSTDYHTTVLTFDFSTDFQASQP
jgi:hypothetical protein